MEFSIESQDLQSAVALVSCLRLNLQNTNFFQGTCGFVIGYFVLLALLSAMLGFAVRTDIRGLMLPWMAMMWVVVFFQVVFGLWLVFGYYIYLETVFVAVCDWVWASLNLYCIYVVRSHYRNVKYMQSPDIEYVSPY